MRARGGEQQQQKADDGRPALRRHRVGGWRPARATLAALATLIGGVATAFAAASPDTAPSGPIRIERVAFSGGTGLDEATLQGLAAPFLNRPLRLDELEELRQRVSDALVQRGRTTSGAVYPADALQGAVLHVRLIDGVVTELRAEGLAGLDRRYIEHRLAAPGEVVDLPRLERRFRALLTDPLFSRLQVRLLPMEDRDGRPLLGQSLLLVDAQRAPAWSLTVFAHNHQAPSVGSAVGGAELALRNLAGWGDALGLTLSRSRGGDGGELAWTLPLAAGLPVLTLRAASTQASVVEEPVAQLDVASRVWLRDATLSAPLLDDGARRVAFGLTLGQRRNRTLLGGEPFSFVAGEPSGDVRLHSWRWFHDQAWRADNHSVAWRVQYATGRSNLPDVALIDSQPPRRYALWQAQLHAAWQPVPTGGQAVVRAAAQHTRDRLVPMEQFALGGRQTLRGWRENQLVRDRGWSLSVEWQQPWRWGPQPAQQLRFVPFVDAGAAAAVGGAWQQLASAGLGLQWQHDGLEAELFAGRALQRRPDVARRDLQDRGLHLQWRWRL